MLLRSSVLTAWSLLRRNMLRGVLVERGTGLRVLMVRRTRLRVRYVRYAIVLRRS